MENWKKIKGYTHYEVSDLGRVRNTKTGVFLKPQVQAVGYKFVNLYNNGKMRSWYVHRLVALHFIDNPNGWPQINHKDEDKLNNRVENLEWCTCYYNVNYGRRNSSYWKPVEMLDFDGNVLRRFDSVSKAAEYIKMFPSSISNAVRGVYKQAGGYKWRYAKKKG